MRSSRRRKTRCIRAALKSCCAAARILRLLQKARAGVQAGAVSIPTRYIHSPSELCAVSDVEDAAKLLAQYALQK